MSISWNDPLSRRVSRRSRAVSFPSSCWRSTARWLPEWIAWSRSLRRSSMRSSVPMRRLPFDSEVGGMATRYALITLDEATSTQDEARTRYRGGPLLVVTGHQTAGRGRSGRRWENAPRAMAASCAFAPDWPRAAWPRLSLVAGLAARDVFDFDLKWPNDLIADGRK